MKKLIIICLIGIICILSFINYSKEIDKHIIFEAKEFCLKNKLNSDYFIFVDFSESTSKKRFKLYSLKENKIIYSCKCAHGNDGSLPIEANINSFSNKINSHKSSLGKYRIGKKRKINSVDGMFDVSMYNIPCYELHGLESTNSNAHKRGILIHPDPILTNSPTIIFPWHSFGCFSIPMNSFKKIEKYIDSNKNMLLYCYYKK